jgi:dTDP-glucose 4,6-dehydratase
MAAWSLRFDFQPDFAQVRPVVALAIFFILGQLILGHAFQLYRGRYRVGSIDEVSGVTLTVLILVTLATLCVLFFRPAGVPRSIPAIAGALALGVMLSGRVALRLYRMRFVGTDVGARTLVYGAGHTGEHLVRLMLSDPSKTFHPVGVLDDDSEKQRLRSYGVRVLGKNEDLERAVAQTEATVLVVAMTRISAAQLRDLDRRCLVLGVELRVIPTGNQLLTEGVQLGDIASVTVEDMLGRRPIEADEAGISDLLRGKRVLITGAGGSIGAELSRQVSRYEPAFMGVLDRDESAIQAVQMSIKGHGLLGDEDLILADIRDADRLSEVFAAVRPDIVFHAAALKHLSLLESFPEEAFKTNILGTQNVLDAAVASGTTTFVNISTDKAADPTSVLGMSKLVTERLTAGADPKGSRRFLSVRFGNVLGSRGSVLNLFREQIISGGPVTVTDPDVTRYFMTVGEAVHLVLQAAAIGESGTTLILDMGSPVRIADVAEQLIEISGRDIEIAYVGLRPAEKLHENLVSETERPEPTQHSLITKVDVVPTTIDHVHDARRKAQDAYAAMLMLTGSRAAESNTASS